MSPDELAPTTTVGLCDDSVAVCGGSLCARAARPVSA